jgi:two-component system sensor histidine kinase/response regulator
MHIKKIMIVDDLPEVTYTVKYGLEKLNPDFDVTRVESGKKCLELLNNNQLPDLILLDIMMPEMNGWELARLLRKNIEWRKIPIIFLTATEDETSKITGKIIGEAFIEKPFDVPSLMKKIDEILSKK